MNNAFHVVRKCAAEFPHSSPEAAKMWDAGVNTWDYATRGVNPPEFECTICKTRPKRMNEEQALKHIESKTHKAKWAMELLAK